MQRNPYKEVPLTGCQLCIAPAYLLPHSFGLHCELGDEGEIVDSNGLHLAGLPWVFDSETGELVHFLVDIIGRVAVKEDFDTDARAFEKCWARDVRFLHNLNHDHDCSTTCVKNVKKKSAEEAMKLLRSNRAPPCRFDFIHIVEVCIEEAVKKIRRRGKELVHVPHIVSTCARNQCGLCALERPQPFRSASSDLGLATLRGNNDFRYMPRGFIGADAFATVFRCDATQLAACFHSMRTALEMYAAVRGMAHSIVALHAHAHVVDYYITKYLNSYLQLPTHRSVLLCGSHYCMHNHIKK